MRNVRVKQFVFVIRCCAVLVVRLPSDCEWLTGTRSYYWRESKWTDCSVVGFCSSFCKCDYNWVSSYMQIVNAHSILDGIPMPLLSVRVRPNQNAIENPSPSQSLDRANERGQNGWRKMQQQQGTLGAHHKNVCILTLSACVHFLPNVLWLFLSLLSIY